MIFVLSYCRDSHPAMNDATKAAVMGLWNSAFSFGWVARTYRNYKTYIRIVNVCLSCWVPRPRWWGKGGTIRINRSLRVYCILSNAEITCSPDQKAVQECVSVTDDWIKSARMSSVKIMVSSHLVESVQQAWRERFMLQDSVEKLILLFFLIAWSVSRPNRTLESVIDTDLPLRFLM